MGIECEIVLSLKQDVRLDNKLKGEIIEIFIPRIVHPYFRQTIAESLVKVGLPSLYIPLLESLEDCIYTSSP